MHSMFLVVFAALLIAFVGQPSWASASCEGDGASNCEELEQKYYKIFSGNWFDMDPATTKRWLDELSEQLKLYDDDEGKKEKYDKVKRLLALNEIDQDCAFTNNERGDELVANYRLFTAPNSTITSPPIKTYIASRLVRLYDQCRESFEVNTETAVNRLSSNSPDDYERMERLMELGIDETDPTTLVVQYLLEQVDKYPEDEDEFEREFNQYVGRPCEAVCSELHFMVYFDAFLTVKEIKWMGPFVRLWHNVYSVCRLVLSDDEQRVVTRKVYDLMSSVIKHKNFVAADRYNLVFEKPSTWPMEPEETYRQLVLIAEAMKKGNLNILNSEEQARRRLEVVRLLELGQFWQTNQCDMAAAIEVNRHLSKNLLVERSSNIQRYLLRLRDQAFELCRSEMAKQVASSVQRLEQDPLWRKISRLRALFAEKFDRLPAGEERWSTFCDDSMLELMGEQAGGGPLTLDQVQLSKQLEAPVLEPCKKINHEFSCFGHVQNIWRLEVADQVDPAVRYWLLSYEACGVLTMKFVPNRIPFMLAH